MDVIVTLPNDLELADELGKKGSIDSMAFYNRKLDNGVITVLVPTDIDKRYHALPESITLADVVVLSSTEMDALFGETLLACSLLGKEVLITDDNDVSGIVAGLQLNHKIVKRGEVLGELPRYAGHDHESQGDTRIDIDRAFPVNGVGDVALGFVTRGSVSKHDKLLHGSGIEVTVRSIQCQDEDVESAGVGARVGLALKGISHSDMEKGDVLSKKRIPRSRDFEVKFRLARVAKAPPPGDMRCGIASNFTYSEALLSGDGDTRRIRTERAVALDVGDRALFIRNEKPRIFAAGEVVKIL